MVSPVQKYGKSGSEMLQVKDKKECKLMELFWHSKTWIVKDWFEWSL